MKKRYIGQEVLEGVKAIKEGKGKRFKVALLRIANRLTNLQTGCQFYKKYLHTFAPEVREFLKTEDIDIVDFSEFVTGDKPGFNTWGVCFVGKVR